jgi:hypothetical protein
MTDSSRTKLGINPDPSQLSAWLKQTKTLNMCKQTFGEIQASMKLRVDMQS